MSEEVQAAIVGTNYTESRGFVLSFTTSNASGSICKGAYELIATQDCWVRLGGAATVPTTQPATDSGLFFCAAYVPKPLSVVSDTTIQAIGVTASGNLNITGPIKRGAFG